jgi:hypothetical protein
MCANIATNTTAGGPADSFGNTPPGLEVFKGSSTSTTYKFGIVGLSPSPATAAQTETYLAAHNTSTAGGGFFAGKHVAVVGGDQFTSCTLPF